MLHRVIWAGIAPPRPRASVLATSVNKRSVVYHDIVHMNPSLTHTTGPHPGPVPELISMKRSDTAEEYNENDLTFREDLWPRAFGKGGSDLRIEFFVYLYLWAQKFLRRYLGISITALTKAFCVALQGDYFVQKHCIFPFIVFSVSWRITCLTVLTTRWQRLPRSA